MALRSVILMGVFCAVFSNVANVGLSQPDCPCSFFDDDDEDWEVVDLTYRAVGAPPPILASYEPNHSVNNGVGGGGHVWFDDVTDDVFYWSAPDMFLGDQSPSYGASLQYHLKAEHGSYLFNQEDVVLVGAGRTLVYDTAVVPNGTWRQYNVGLTENGWRVGSLGGPLATQDDMLAVLEDVEQLYIRGEFRGTIDDIGRLDDVKMFRRDDGQFSTFEVDREGWEVVDLRYRSVGAPPSVLADYDPLHLADGGVGDSGHIWFDDVTNDVFYWSAPSEYLGDRSASYGASLQYFLKAEQGSYVFNQEDVVLVGAGRTLVFDTPIVPGDTEWQEYNVSLTENGWRVGSLSGPLATQADMEAVLDDLEALYIRGEFRGTIDDLGRLDEVNLFELAECDPVEPGGIVDLLGDFNEDGIVDAADHIVWRKNFGTTNELPNDNGLGTPIGNAHYDLWKSHFGSTAPGGLLTILATPVPEPSAAGIALAGMMAGIVIGRRRSG